MGNTMDDLERMMAAARAPRLGRRWSGTSCASTRSTPQSPALRDGQLGEIFYLEADYFHNLFGQADPERSQSGHRQRQLVPGRGEGDRGRRRAPVRPAALVRELARGRGAWASATPSPSGPCATTTAWPRSSASRAGRSRRSTALYGPVGDRPDDCNMAVYGTKGTVRDRQLMVGDGHEVETMTCPCCTSAGTHGSPARAVPGRDPGGPPDPGRCLQRANSAAATIMAAEAIRTGEKQAVPIYRP